MLLRYSHGPPWIMILVVFLALSITAMSWLMSDSLSGFKPPSGPDGEDLRPYMVALGAVGSANGFLRKG